MAMDAEAWGFGKSVFLRLSCQGAARERTTALRSVARVFRQGIC